MNGVRTTSTALVACLLHSIPALAASSAPDATRKKVVVLEPQGEGVTDGVLKALDDMVLTELSRRPDYEVLGSSDVKRMLGMIETQQRVGCDATADACLAEIGGALGAQYLVSTTVAKLETRYLVNTKLIDVLHARVVERHSEQVEATTDALASAVQRLASALLPDDEKRGKFNWSSIGLGAASVAALCVGVVVAWRSQSMVTDAQEHPARDAAEYQTRVDNVTFDRRIAFGAYGLSVALGVTAVVVF